MSKTIGYYPVRTPTELSFVVEGARFICKETNICNTEFTHSNQNTSLPFEQ